DRKPSRIFPPLQYSPTPTVDPYQYFATPQTYTRANDMSQSKRDAQPSVQDVALIVGGGPGISSSCARLFAENGMRVAVAARNPEKAVLEALDKTHGIRRYACDASEPAAVERLFENVVRDLGTPRLVV